MVLVPGSGPWVLLGSVVTDAPLDVNEPMVRSCGTCTACIPACPTGAILDRRRARRAPLPRLSPAATRASSRSSCAAPSGDRLYGCDDCLTSCPPGNRAMESAAAVAGPDIVEILGATDRELLDRYGHFYLPARRPRILRRNALVAAGNDRSPFLEPVVIGHLGHPDWLLRSHAAWAVGQFATLIGDLRSSERSPTSGTATCPRRAQACRSGAKRSWGPTLSVMALVAMPLPLSPDRSSGPGHRDSPMLIVSDVHGAATSLRRVAGMGEPLLVLGDLINYIDYRTNEGIVADISGRHLVDEFVRLRGAEGNEAASAFWTATVGRTAPMELRGSVPSATESAYREVCDALSGCDAYVTYGNVDRPGMLAAQPAGWHPIRRCRSGRGRRDSGSVSPAAASTSIGTPGEVTEAQMASKLDQLGPVDILATHVPPAMPALACDVIGGREKGSTSILAYLERHAPAYHYFGDIHQPRATSGGLVRLAASTSATSGRRVEQFAMAEVDLDRLASAYRFRPASPASLERAARAGSRLAPGTRILDVGGGPANHAAVWAEQGHRPRRSRSFDGDGGDRSARVGLEPSSGIRKRCRSVLEHFDLVWFHLSVHYGDWQLALDEAQRVLDDSGPRRSLDARRGTPPAVDPRSMVPVDCRHRFEEIPRPDRGGGVPRGRMPIVTATRPHEAIVRPRRCVDPGRRSRIRIDAAPAVGRGTLGRRRGLPNSPPGSDRAGLL